MHAGGDPYCFLSWDLICSRHEESAGLLSVGGMIERPDGKYDHVDWLDCLALKAGDCLTFHCGADQGTTPVAKTRTHEQLEQLRFEVGRAERAGEYDAARAAPRMPVRSGCGIMIRSPDGESREHRADGPAMSVFFQGHIMRDTKPLHWRLRLWSDREPAAGFWQPFEGGICATIAADSTISS